MRKINKVIIHCLDTYEDMDVGVKEVDVWHKKRGFSRVGYHYIIRRDGTLEQGRPLVNMGAHCKGHNKDSIGIALAGGKGKDGKPEDNFTTEQLQICKMFLQELKQRFEGITIHGHKEFSKFKTCPNFDLAKVL